MDLKELKSLKNYEQLFNTLKEQHPKVKDLEEKILIMVNYFEPIFKNTIKEFPRIFLRLTEEEQKDFYKNYSKKGKK